jgi:hypothetical protein
MDVVEKQRRAHRLLWEVHLWPANFWKLALKSLYTVGVASKHKNDTAWDTSVNEQAELQIGVKVPPVSQLPRLGQLLVQQRSLPYLSIQEVWWGQNRPGTTFCDRLDFGLYRVFDRL